MGPRHLIFILIAFLVILDSIVLYNHFFLNQQESENPQVCFNENCINVEIADTPTERVRGLSNRDTLLDNQGMLFIFQEPDIQGFWMKDTLIPLDMIWLDSKSKVNHIEENVQPCEKDCKIYYSDKKALYVLELNAGKSKELRIEEGSKLTLDI